jgi:hypothetical protein
MTLMIQSINGSFVQEVQGLTLWSELEQNRLLKRTTVRLSPERHMLPRAV